MKVFMTGASGWIGSAVVPELLAAGHEVTSLARSEESAAKLRAAGVTPLTGTVDDLDVLRDAAAAAEGVIHLAFKHDFGDFANSGLTERAAVEAMTGVLEGTGKPFLFASGVAGLRFGGAPSTEEDASPFSGPESPRGGAENLALGTAERGVRPVALRFSPTVHGAGDHGFIAELVRVARERGAAGYVGDGASRWPAVARPDAGRMVALALEGAPAGFRAHAVGEPGIPSREIAEAIGRGLGLPAVSVAAEEATAHFGWIGVFFGMDIPATSTITQSTLGWTPSGPTLLEDLAGGSYFA